MPDTLDDQAITLDPERDRHNDRILTIYLSDNALINQKNTYYFAANALFVLPVVNIYRTDPRTAALLCTVGVIFSFIMLASIARTAAYRNKWRSMLADSDKKAEKLYSDSKFPWWGRVPSNPILIAPPVIGLGMWLSAFFLLQC